VVVLGVCCIVALVVLFRHWSLPRSPLNWPKRESQQCVDRDAFLVVLALSTALTCHCGRTVDFSLMIGHGRGSLDVVTASRAIAVSIGLAL